MGGITLADAKKIVDGGRLVFGNAEHIKAVRHIEAYNAAKELLGSGDLMCMECGGTGQVVCEYCNGHGGVRERDIECMSTNGLIDLAKRHTGEGVAA